MTTISRAFSLALVALALAPVPSQAQCMSPWLTSDQVVPPNTAGGSGLAFFQIDTVANTLLYEVTFIGLSLVETSAHIHGFSGVGENAPVLFSFPLGDNKTGTWNYPEALEAQLLAGQAYIDIHTTGHPEGRLRGQMVVDLSDATLFGRLTVEQLIPPQVGPGQEALIVVNLDTTADTAQVDFQLYPVAGSFSSALLGYAPAGQTGSTLLFLSSGFTSTWNYPPGDEGKILSGLLYAENYNPNGGAPWTRGQVHLACTAQPPAVAYCTAGISSTGCAPGMYASGYPSASAPADFHLKAAGVPGLRNGIFFFGTSGRQANPWGNGSSFQCVKPPVSRAGLMSGEGTAGMCDSVFVRDLNALWCPTCPKAAQNPGAGAVVQAQLWYRDPLNSSNQSTSLSDALEFAIQP